MVSTVMGLVCLALIISLYAFSGGWKTYGGMFGLWKWLKQGGLSNPTPYGQKHGGQRSENVAEVVDVLDDIYREFVKKLESQTQTLHNAIDHSVLELRSIVETLELRIEKLEQSKPQEEVSPQTSEMLLANTDNSNESSFHPSVNLTGQCASTGEPIYFHILDGICQGSNSAEIAQNLGVTVNDVEMVRRVMEAPSVSSLN